MWKIRVNMKRRREESALYANGTDRQKSGQAGFFFGPKNATATIFLATNPPKQIMSVGRERGEKLPVRVAPL